MKESLLPLLILISCFLPLPNSAHLSGNFTRKNGASESSAVVVIPGRQSFHGLNGTVGLNGMHEEFSIKQMQTGIEKANPAGSGADTLHRPPEILRRPHGRGRSGASTIQAYKFIPISNTLVQVSIAFLLGLIFFF
ncbi:uncharacterized protein LOC131256143 isoform X1 [Magnolia sinica]|uniref:uncharacterized protein LOC131256143 isoform X1 n=1 Tax=Magnolia sinica TaxID=86752 RepID=UPI002658441C|nr:uncharacterized protein LOC131256143 isoform X1 [Magnolia sinica]